MSRKKYIDKALEYTPMENEAKILTLYMRNIKETEFKTFSTFYYILPAIGNQIDSLSESQYENKNREYIKLYSEFLDKWDSSQPHFPGFSKAMVFENLKKVIDQLVALSPRYVTFDLTEDCSIFFQSSVNNKNIYLELFFTEDTEDLVEAIINIYEGGKCTLAYGGSIKSAFSEINSIVSKNLRNIEPTPSSYDLSDSTFATAAL